MHTHKIRLFMLDEKIEFSTIGRAQNIIFSLLLALFVCVNVCAIMKAESYSSRQYHKIYSELLSVNGSACLLWAHASVSVLTIERASNNFPDSQPVGGWMCVCVFVFVESCWPCHFLLRMYNWANTNDLNTKNVKPGGAKREGGGNSFGNFGNTKKVCVNI